MKRQKHGYLAIVTLLLGTGILCVSECVGLDIQDIDFDNNGIRIVRKGGNETIVYFGDEVADALKSSTFRSGKGSLPSPVTRTLVFDLYPAPSNRCSGRRKYGKKILPGLSRPPEEDHPA